MFITVRDRKTRYLYDIDERSFREDAHERVDHRPASEKPGRAKPRLGKGTRARPVSGSPAETDSTTLPKEGTS